MVEGELVIPGFSNYLQSIGDGLLLGIGQENEPGTWNTRMHVSVFDVSEGADLSLIERQFLDETAQWSSSDAQFDHQVDHVLTDSPDSVTLVDSAVTGREMHNGWWDSDHAGLASALLIR